MTTHVGLIYELETSLKNNRELDYRIAFVIQWRPNEQDDPKFAKSFALHENAHGYKMAWAAHRFTDQSWKIPYYTTSLDAARSISDWVLIFLGDIGADGLPYAVLGDPSMTPPGEVNGIGATIELALCIAGIKTHA